MKTDRELQTDVIAELAWEASVDGSNIGVEVKDGVVTLAGSVNSFQEKWEAEQAAQRVTGVKALAVEIEVKLPGASQRTDADIAHAAKNLLEWMTYAPKDDIKVMVEGGWITLSGEVEWDYQRNAAVSGVRPLMGVTGVSDHMIIKPKASLDTVRGGIESALKRRTRKNLNNISVEVVGDRVVLSGNVVNWSERDLIKHAAWSAPGVRSVVDNICVTY